MAKSYLSYRLSSMSLRFDSKMKHKAFWPVFVFRRGRLSFKKLFLKLILPSCANSKTSFK